MSRAVWSLALTLLLCSAGCGYRIAGRADTLPRTIRTIAVPAFAIGSNVLMGLGEVRASFVLGVQMLVVSVVAYLLTIPLWGAIGAAVGVVVATYVMSWIALERVRHHVPFTIPEVLTRWRDIRVFVRSQLRKLTRHRA